MLSTYIWINIWKIEKRGTEWCGWKDFALSGNLYQNSGVLNIHIFRPNALNRRHQQMQDSEEWLDLWLTRRFVSYLKEIIFRICTRHYSRPATQAECGLWAMGGNFWTRWSLVFLLTYWTSSWKTTCLCPFPFSFQPEPIHGKGSKKLIHWRQPQPVRPTPWDIFTLLQC